MISDVFQAGTKNNAQIVWDLGWPLPSVLPSATRAWGAQAMPFRCNSQYVAFQRSFFQANKPQFPNVREYVPCVFFTSPCPTGDDANSLCSPLCAGCGGGNANGHLHAGETLCQKREGLPEGDQDLQLTLRYTALDVQGGCWCPTSGLGCFCKPSLCTVVFERVSRNKPRVYMIEDAEWTLGPERATFGLLSVVLLLVTDSAGHSVSPCFQCL